MKYAYEKIIFINIQDALYLINDELHMFNEN